MEEPRCLLSGHRQAARSRIWLGRFTGGEIELGPTSGARLPSAATWNDLGRPASNLRIPSAASAHPPTRPGPQFSAWEARVSHAAPSRDPVESESPFRILVADDDMPMRILMARLLANSGYLVETAPDGLAAWRTLKPGHFDLLITDQEMPHLTGLELAQKILGAQMNIPIILTTGSHPVRDPEEGTWTAIAAIMLKPIHPTDLLDSVASVLRGQHPEKLRVHHDPPAIGSPTTTARNADLSPFVRRFSEAGNDSRA